MVKQMNKKDFINALSKGLSYSEEKCIIINDILEHNFFLSKSKKDIIVNELIVQLDISQNEAEHIYNISIKIIKDEVKRKLINPFKK